MSFFRRAYGVYDKYLVKYPIPVKCVTALSLFSVGDFCCQTFIERGSVSSSPQEKLLFRYWNYDRTLRLAVYGFFILAPSVHHAQNWFARLPSKPFFHHYITQRLATPFLSSVYKISHRNISATSQPLPIPQSWYNGFHNFVKVIIDQSFFSPLFIVLYFTFNCIWEGKNFKEWKEYVQQMFVPSWRISILLWPTTQIINWTFIPLRYRVFFLNSVSAMWNSYLSYVHHKKRHEDSSSIMKDFAVGAAT